MSHARSLEFIAIALASIGLFGSFAVEPAPSPGDRALTSADTTATPMERAPIRGRVIDARGRGITHFEVRLHPLPDAANALATEPPSGSLRQHLERRAAWHDGLRSGSQTITTGASGEFVFPDVAVPVWIEPLGSPSHPGGAVRVDGAPTDYARPGSRVEIHGLTRSARTRNGRPPDAVRASRSAIVIYDPPLWTPNDDPAPKQESAWSRWWRGPAEPEAPPVVHWLGAANGSPVDRDLLHREGLLHSWGPPALELEPGYYWIGIGRGDRGFDWTGGVHIGPGTNSIAHTFADLELSDAERAPPLFARVEADPPIPLAWLTVALVDRSTGRRLELQCTPAVGGRVRLEAGSREANDLLGRALEGAFDLRFECPGRAVRVPLRESREVVAHFEDAGVLEIAIDGASFQVALLELVSLAPDPRPSVKLELEDSKSTQRITCDPGDYMVVLSTGLHSVAGTFLLEHVRVDAGRQTLRLTLGRQGSDPDLEAGDVVVGLCGERFRDQAHLEAIRERLTRVAHRDLHLPALILRGGRVLEVELTAHRLAWGPFSKWEPAPPRDGDDDGR